MDLSELSAEQWSSLRFQLVAPGYESKTFTTSCIPVGRNHTSNSDSTTAASYPSAVLSKRHAHFQSDLDKLYLTDLDSWHGTFIQSGKDPKFKLKPNLPYLVLDGDVVTFGKAVHKGKSVHPPVVVTVRILPLQHELRVSGRYGLDDADEDSGSDTSTDTALHAVGQIEELPPQPASSGSLSEIARHDASIQTKLESDEKESQGTIPEPCGKPYAHPRDFLRHPCDHFLLSDSTTQLAGIVPSLPTNLVQGNPLGSPTPSPSLVLSSKKRNESTETSETTCAKRFRFDPVGIVVGAIAGGLATYAGLAFTEL